MKNKAISIGISIFTFFSIFFISLKTWIPNNFGNTSIEQIIFTLKSPLKGSDTSFIFSFILFCLIIPFLLSFIILAFIRVLTFFKVTITLKKHNKQKEFCFFKHLKKHLLLVSSVCFVISCWYSLVTLNVTTYISNIMNESTLYEDYYIDPSTVNFTFPEKKRNLIHIYLESMETTFKSKELGGAMDENLIIELTEMADANVSFSDKNGGGFHVPPGAGWTVAAMVAQSAAVPLNLPVEANSYKGDVKFLPGLYTIGDILDDEGYYQELFIGSKAEFGGRDTFYKQHRNTEIKDYNYANKNNLIPKDYFVWWGYEDEKLFSLAQDELMTISKDEKPFSFTMLTTDTHHIGGYPCPKCPNTFSDQFSNVVSCSSKQVTEFVTWCQTQDFYDNTTIVITGDHLSMDPDYFKGLDKNYIRKGYNVFLNSTTDASKADNREFNSFDIFPSTLASLGVEWKGDRLGLGTNLFGKSKTLVEKLGVKKFDKEVAKSSDYYTNSILFE